MNDCTAAPAPEGITFGYARVSTAEQRLDLQLDAFEKATIHPDYIYQEHISGVKAKRPQLTECLRTMRKGDTLVVWKLDRLGRSVKELIEILEQLRERGIEFQSLNDHIDTSSAVGKMVFHILAAFAQFERDLNSERTIAGLAVARKRGRMGGRKPILSDLQVREGQDLIRHRTRTVTDVCKIFRTKDDKPISRQTWYRAVERVKLKEAREQEKRAA